MGLQSQNFNQHLKGYQAPQKAVVMNSFSLAKPTRSRVLSQAPDFSALEEQPAAPNTFVDSKTAANTITGADKTLAAPSLDVNADVTVARPVNTDYLDEKFGGVLKGKSGAVIKAAESAGIDPAFFASVVALETGWGKSKAAKDYNNPGGLMDGKTKSNTGFQKFASIEEGLAAMANKLKTQYIDGGLGSGKLTTVDAIHKVYSPPGADNDPNDTNKGWGTGIVSIMKRLQPKNS